MLWLLSALAVVGLDQLTKALALSRSAPSRMGPSRTGPSRTGPSGAGPSGAGRRAPRIQPIENRALARRFSGRRSVWVLVWLAAVGGALALIVVYPELRSSVPQIALGAAVGGATGNLLDLLRRGAVIDFIDLRFWPVFNLADVAIVVGAPFVLWALV